MRALRGSMSSVRWVFDSGSWKPMQSEWIRAAQCVQPEEKQRIGKFVFKRDAKASMVGRLMLRKMIHRVTKISYKDIHLSRTDKGKPFLTNTLPEGVQGLSFNVSHHGNLVVLAGDTLGNVGVDVMKLSAPVGARSISEFFNTMQRQFTEEEWRCIRQGQDDEAQLAIFYRLWCLKESYVKALGVGIGFEVKRLNFDLHDPLTEEGKMVTSTTLHVDGEGTRGWGFQETLLEGHCIAVAHRKDEGKEINDKTSAPFSFLTYDELLEGTELLSDPDESYGQAFIHKDEDPFASRKKPNS
ncbi:L-aminoadipate-semialdehyde dehydrogenase-phosphopantetheinyl transferase-like [Mya arenaria]|uniref:L-aminoadipate-semialdehyde dehydrogenase-phosphopantetheinyl transferase-like n=1 Tax=Mya arenaria TaxID=6604 RepID=UPI0022E5DD54|nr:L-aminoadipate-semialdehyde dehydrogenase-phosphopantetheinyl transferase-like [Mya arenaria]XP_052795487.1 L-aminoadipate-semialdehyde dehydrogenase-phosphopantetheinyl transferase-like [Mya arenaria]